jgi:hypothetical protein
MVLTEVGVAGISSHGRTPISGPRDGLTEPTVWAGDRQRAEQQ